jgi:hypothetical protein
MKNYILISLLLCISQIAISQTPFSMVSSHNTYEQPARISASSMNNPWVGAKLAYNIAGDVSNSFLLSGRVMYTVLSGEKYAIPVMANVGFNNLDSLDKDNGVNIGAYPWYSLINKGSATLLLHGGLNYHVIDKNDAGYIQEVRMLAGIEAAFYSKTGSPPTTLSIAPEYVINTGGNLSNTFALQFTGVLPIANGLGLLVESDVPLDKTTQGTGLKIGVIINNAIR